ncbi:MAG: hypothetical protein HY354_00895 [Planctomycetes bacterium]|nr:hypothetical protein [Planctomycetota bacterium]
MGIIIRRGVILVVSIIGLICGVLFLESLIDAAGFTSYKHIVGVAGSIMIMVSILYSLRKRKIIFTKGSLNGWRVFHEWLTIVGAFLVFVHGGFHTHAFVPIAAGTIMFISVASGLTGRYLYLKTNDYLLFKRDELRRKGLGEEAADEELQSLIITHKIMKNWRSVHVPIVTSLAVTAIFHIVSALYYEGFWN